MSTRLSLIALALCALLAGAPNTLAAQDEASEAAEALPPAPQEPYVIRSIGVLGASAHLFVESDEHDATAALDSDEKQKHASEEFAEGFAATFPDSVSRKLRRSVTVKRLDGTGTQCWRDEFLESAREAHRREGAPQPNRCGAPLSNAGDALAVLHLVGLENQNSRNVWHLMKRVGASIITLGFNQVTHRGPDWEDMRRGLITEIALVDPATGRVIAVGSSGTGAAAERDELKTPIRKITECLVGLDGLAPDQLDAAFNSLRTPTCRAFAPFILGVTEGSAE